jgi:hypothetical protein
MLDVPAEQRGQHHGVHQRRGESQPGVLEYQCKRADANVGHVIAKQVRVGIRNEHANDQDGNDIEQQDAPERLSDRARNRASGVRGFTSRHADRLGSLK